MNRSAWITSLVIVIAVLAGAGAATASDLFDDVAEGAFYAGPVAWAAENGITNGCSETAFCPNDPVTRGENLTFAKRYDDNIVQPALEDIGDDIDGLRQLISEMPRVYWALVDDDGEVISSSHAVAVVHDAPGIYSIRFPGVDIAVGEEEALCAASFTSLSPGRVGQVAYTDVDTFGLQTLDLGGTSIDTDFSFVVTC